MSVKNTIRRTQSAPDLRKPECSAKAAAEAHQLAGKPLVQGATDPSVAVKEGQSNLNAPASDNESGNALNLKSDFVATTTAETASHDSLADGHLQLKRSPPLASDKPTQVSDGQFDESIPMVSLSKLGQTPLPTSLMEAEAVDYPIGEIVDQLYKEKEDAATKPIATPGPATPPKQQAAVNATLVPPKPDTSQDELTALKTQIGYSADDLAFLKSIEDRLAKMAKKYPHSKSQAELRKAHQIASDQCTAMSLQIQEYQKEYARKTGLPVEPLKKGLEDLAKQGRGAELKPQPAPKPTLKAKPVQRTDHGAGVKGLKERYQMENKIELMKDKSRESDSSTEESEASLGPLSKPPVMNIKLDPSQSDEGNGDDNKIGKRHKKGLASGSASESASETESVVQSSQMEIPDYELNDSKKPQFQANNATEISEDSFDKNLDDLLKEMSTAQG